MQPNTFVGYDGNTYSADLVERNNYEIRHDGRFWHISFPIEGELGAKQVYRGRELPKATDHDRWVHYRAYPPGMKREFGKPVTP